LIVFLPKILIWFVWSSIKFVFIRSLFAILFTLVLET